MAATTGFYLHPYYCFCKDADSNWGFTWGVETGPMAAVTAAPKVPHRPYVPAILARTYVAADPSTGATKILA